MNLDMDRHIHETAAVCDSAGLEALERALWLSFDSGMCGTRARQGRDQRPRAQAPKLLEEVYNLEDALLVGGLINTLFRDSNPVHVGCLAQLVNIIAPLVTTPAACFARARTFLMRGRSVMPARACLIPAFSLTPVPLERPDCRPTSPECGRPVSRHRRDADRRTVRHASLMFNRDLDAERDVLLEWDDVTPARALMCERSPVPT